MKPKIFLPLLLSFLILNSSLLISTVRYVSPTGSSTPPYTSWATAADSIMECINISVFGDTIYVANGTYKEQVVMIPGLSLIGAGMDSCVIDFINSGVAVQVVENCVLKEFNVLVQNNINTIGISGSGNNSLITLNNVNNASQGIYISNSNHTVSKNILMDIRTRGINVFNSNSLVKENIINTTTDFGSGIHIEAFDINYNTTLDSNYIESIGNGIFIAFGSKPTITNNIIVLKGDYSKGYQGSYTDTAKVFNNIVIASQYLPNSDGFVNTGVPHLTFNNIAVGEMGEGISVTGVDLGLIHLINNMSLKTNKGIVGGADVEVHHNNSWGNTSNYSGFTPDSTNLSVDPMIVNDDSTKGDLDFHLQMFSHLIDAGDPNIFDVDGSRSDIGFYGGPFGESYSYIDLAPQAPVNLNATLDSLTVGITWNKNTEVDFNHYNVYRDTTKSFQIDSTNLFLSTPVANLIDILPDYVEKIYYKVTAVDNQDNESEPSEEVGFILTSITDHQLLTTDYRLYQNYPNPFNPSTKISYRLKERGYVKLYVYDIKGELVSTLVNQTQEAGFYEVDFNVKRETSDVKSDLASGIYIYQIMVKNENNIPVFTDMKKMLMLK
ncbi:MAG: right-handed parallel beta-helix repeat-containing protein [Ignavibacteriales bacterium]|nr:right-handed parallel beta-helix repeat-containing protein [Ignavibacteriales bacterium]